MKLTREERKRLRAGDYRALVRNVEPECEKGQILVISWSRPRRYYDQTTGELIEPSPMPLLMIQITGKLRHRKGYWLVRFDVRDRREPKRLVRRKPPALRHDDEEGTEEAARVEGAYTANPEVAVDHLEAVDDLTLRRFTKDARHKELEDLGAFMAAAESVLAAIKEREVKDPGMRRAYWPLRRELDRAIERERRRAA